MPFKRKHGMCGTRFYRIWQGMVSRCTFHTVQSYSRYGGRGITVCDRWRVFDNFLEDMMEGYEENLTLERNENDGHYEKSNCRWATMQEQFFNRSDNVHLTIDGETKFIFQWAKMYMINEDTLRNRLFHGWTPDRAVKQKVRSKRKHISDMVNSTGDNDSAKETLQSPKPNA